MALIRNIFWLAVFVASTLSFVILFEKGTTHFVPNFQKQVVELGQMLREQIVPAKKTDHP